MNEIARENIAGDVYFNSIKDDRFKTMRISATMFMPLKKETAAANSLLPMLLSRSCAEFPDATSLNRKLNSLYGGSVSGYCRKMGEGLALTLSVSGIDDRYTLNGETISKEFVNLLCSMIFRPKLENCAFCKNDFDQEKRQLIESIDAEYNEKRTYASNRCTEIMCKDETFGIRRYGSKEDVESLTEQDLYKAWENLLKTTRVELMMLGSSDSREAKEIFAREFKKIGRAADEVNTEIIKTVKDIKEETETMDIAQSKLFMGFRAGVAEPEDTAAMCLAVAVLGGTPNSKLFTNVREKLSLCYYCAARYDKYKGIVTVDSGVEKENIEKTKEEILNQLEILKKGDITNFEIESAKLSIANSYNTMSDTLGGTEAWYINQMQCNEILSPKQAAEKINAVTKEEIINAANKIKLDTVYVLTSKN